nr:MAG TPA: hypothetical protein [Caudoviricetes sp.]
MMLEKIKEVPFIDESRAVKLSTVDGKIVMERNDRVVWGYEKTALAAENIECYVEADKFFLLLPEIKSLSQDTCLHVELRNGAKYELAFLPVSWETQEMPTEYSDSITFKLADLMLCTLKNLVKPELQCIYIDEEGAVSCDFLSACINKTIKASSPFLLPADVQDLVDGRLCKVAVSEDKLFFEANDFGLVTSKPTHTVDVEGETPWWDGVRGLVDGVANYHSGESLSSSLKRLSVFADYIEFDGNKAVAGSNFEPFAFVDLSGRQYEIERLGRILSTASKMSEVNSNLVMANETSLFLLSPMEEA